MRKRIGRWAGRGGQGERSHLGRGGISLGHETRQEKGQGGGKGPAIGSWGGCWGRDSAVRGAWLGQQATRRGEGVGGWWNTC
eukprot:354052-Chlamydomonas_euryale.AAC.2